MGTRMLGPIPLDFPDGVVSIVASDVVASTTVVSQSAKLQAHIDRIRAGGGVGKITLPASSQEAPIWIGSRLDLDGIDYLEVEGQGNPGLSGGYGTVLKQVTIVENDEPAILVCDDSSGNGVYYFHDFALWGAGQTYATLGGDSNRTTNIYGAQKVTFERVGCYYSRQMGITAAYCDEVHVKDCDVQRCHRDAISVTECNRRFVTNNRIKDCADDSIACHSTYSGGNPPKQLNIITDNIIENAYGIVVIGAVKTVISNNVVDRAKGYCCKFIATGAQGENDVTDLLITDNVFTNVLDADLWGAGSQNAYIIISHPTDSFVEPVVGGTTPRITLPELVSPVSNALNSVNAGGQRIRITNNIMAQTLPAVDDYEDWGFGQFWYHSGYQALAISGAFHALSDGVSLNGAIIDVTISDNTLECLRYPVFFSTTFTSLGYVGVVSNKIRRTPFGGVVFANHGSSVKHGKLDIRDNDIDLDPFFESANRDYVNGSTATVTISQADPAVITWTTHGLFANTAVRFTTTGALPAGLTASGTVGARSYYVRAGATLLTNSFTVAAYPNGPAIATTDAGSGTHTGFASIPDGTWTTGDSKPFLCEVQDWSTTNITGNRLRNLNVAWLSDADTTFGSVKDNIVYMEPSSSATLTSPSHAGNAGVQNPVSLLRSGMLVYEKCIPTSAAYGQVISSRGATGWQTSIPTTGFYLEGEIVWNAAYTVSTQTIGAATPQYALIGWKKMVTGSNHVLNTDWKELRALTGQ